MKKSAIDVWNKLPKELKNSDVTLDRNNPLEAFETLSKHLGMVRKVEVEYELEEELEVKLETESLPTKEVFFPNDILLNEKYKEFLNFRKEIKKKVAPSSIEANKKKLMKLANEDPNTAIEIIEQSIANGWQGFFELKSQSNGRNNQNQQGESFQDRFFKGSTPGVY